MTANEKQVGGDHYKVKPIQPWDFIAANNLDFFQGAVVKYVCRYKDKDGLKDLEKAKHYIEKMIEMAEQVAEGPRVAEPPEPKFDDEQSMELWLPFYFTSSEFGVWKKWTDGPVSEKQLNAYVGGSGAAVILKGNLVRALCFGEYSDPNARKWDIRVGWRN